MKKNKNEISQFDRMIKTPVEKLVISLSIPTIISMLVTNIYNLVDTAFVGRLGTSASGAVGIVFGFMAIIQAFGFMFGQGSGSMISRSLGRRDVKGAGTTASTAFFCAIIIGFVFTLIGFIKIDWLVRVLGSTDTIAPFAKDYIKYILIAAPFMTSSFVLNNILRYEGKATLGMIGLLTGAVLNMAGDPIFMFLLKMGISGAGLSTAISQMASFSILLSMFIRGKTECSLSLKGASFKLPLIFEICATGLPSLLRQGLGSFTTILLNMCAGVYGDVAIAAMSIVSRIGFFIFSVSLGVGQGFQPVSGFNYGAGKYSRLRSAFKFTVLLAEGVMVVSVILVFILSGNLIAIFRDDPQVIEIGTRALRLYCGGLLFLPPCMATEMLYQSTGHKLGATVLSSLRSGLFFIPSLLILAKVRGLAGIQEAQPLAYFLGFIPSIVLLILFLKKLPKEDETK